MIMTHCLEIILPTFNMKHKKIREIFYSSFIAKPISVTVLLKVVDLNKFSSSNVIILIQVRLFLVSMKCSFL